MQCDKCGKEFQTYRGICPYCHNKNEIDTQEQPTITNTPIGKPNSTVPNWPRNPTENIRSQSSGKTRNIPDSTLKYALMAGIVLIVVLSVAAVAQSLLGGSPPSASPSEIYSAPAPTDASIPSVTQVKPSPIVFVKNTPNAVGTLSPYSGNSDDPLTPNLQATKYVAPGSKHTFAVLSTTGSTSNSGSAVISATPNPTTNPTASNTIITSPTTITTIPTLVTESPTPVPLPPIILSVSPERDPVEVGETVNFNVIVESNVHLENVVARGTTYDPLTEGPAGRQLYEEIHQSTALGNNQYKIVIPVATGKNWPAGTMELTELFIINQGVWLSQTWTTLTTVRLNRSSPGGPPEISSVSPDKSEIFAGEGAYFTINVRSSYPVGYYGYTYYDYSTPDGKGARLSGGLDFKNVGGDNWQAKIRFSTSSIWPTGDVVIDEVRVDDAQGQSALWTTHVKAHMIGSTNTKVNGT